MMRGLSGTVLWTCLAVGVGVGLFFLKHEVKELEGRLSGLNAEIHRNQEAIHVLKAEWAYLNDPSRLRQLSERHLNMKPMGPTQVASLDTLPFGPGAAVLAATPAPAPAKPASAPARPAVAKAEAPRPPVHAAAAHTTATATAKGRTIVITSPALADTGER